jgi:C-terminal processing protease CtpA/Prc
LRGKGKRKTTSIVETEELELTFTEPGAWGMTFDWTQIDMTQQVDNAAAVATVLETSGEAARVGVKAGDVVIEVGGIAVCKLADKQVGTTGATFKELLIASKARPCPVRVARAKAPKR